MSMSKSKSNAEIYLEQIKPYKDARLSGLIQEDIVDLIKNDGYSAVESMSILIDIYGMGVKRVREVVMSHPSWAGEADNNQDLRDEFAKTFGKRMIPRKEVKSIILDSPRSADLAYGDIQVLANEIRSVVSRGALLREDGLFECAENFPVHEMGMRKSKALIYEYKLSSCFTPNVFLKIRDRVKEHFDEGLLRFDESDFIFMEKNFNKSNEWMAKNFYADREDFDKMLKEISE